MSTRSTGGAPALTRLGVDVRTLLMNQKIRPATIMVAGLVGLVIFDPAPQRSGCALRQQLLLDHGLCNLYGVERCALQQVVGDDPHR